MLRTVLGVDSAAPGFAHVIVRPHLGALKFAAGSVPHPKGKIDVRVEASGAVSVSLPPGVAGTFEWRGSKRDFAGQASWRL
jgi:hypothetical protein